MLFFRIQNNATTKGKVANGVIYRSARATHSDFLLGETEMG